MEMKKVAIFINTPAQVYFYSNIIKQLEVQGHNVIILAREYGMTLSLLDKMNFRYLIHAKAAKSKLGTVLAFLHSISVSYSYLRRFEPDLLVGDPCAASISMFLRCPCIAFIDSCIGTGGIFYVIIYKLLAKTVLTPTTFEKNMGKKQVRIRGYKELAYLYPNYFLADPSIYEELGMNRGERYVILRFNVFDAVHDIGRHGFSLADKFELVRKLEKHARVFISPEGSLPQDLESYRLPISYHRIHHALYYAHLLVADTGTMITEAAVLGTPGILSFSSAGKFGNFVELEQKYHLIFNYQEPAGAIEKAVELIQQPDLKEKWAEKRQKLLADKIDVTRFLVDFIENYPESFEEYQRNRIMAESK